MYSSRSVVRESSTGGVGGGSPLRSFLTFHEMLEAPATGSCDLGQFGTAFANPGGYFTKDIDMLWPPVTDEHGDFQVLIAPQHLQRPPSPRPTPVPEIDEQLQAAEVALQRLLALASVVGLPRQIERESEASTGTSPHMPSFVTHGHVPTLSVRDNGAAAGELDFGSDLEDRAPAQSAALAKRMSVHTDV